MADSDNSCQVNPHADNFVRSDSWVVKQVAVTPPTPESAGCVFEKKNNAIFVRLENGREGEIFSLAGF